MKKTLKLYNAVEAKNGGEYKILSDYGVIVEPSASHALTDIKRYLKECQLNGQQLNATFHKSWKVVQESSREELAVHQILHYLTTYGTGHTSSFVYTPDEELDVPKVETVFKVIRGLDKDELISKCLDLFSSGVALKEETIYDIMEVLLDLGYTFTGGEDIKNKEALILICREQGIVPKDPVEFLRYMVYIATGNTLLIKNSQTKTEIVSNVIGSRDKKFALENALSRADKESLATIFNRFKPIFLAFKPVLGESGKRIINKISKLSKTLHTPISYNILNDIGYCTYKELEAQRDNLLNANFFQLARCIQYLKQNKEGDAKVYQIRNGKSYVKSHETKLVAPVKKTQFLLKIIKEKYPMNGLSIYIPSDVDYALPTSEKLFVGNVPMGTKLSTDKGLAMGIYWENSGGARDLDLSAVSESAKVGWNRDYNDGGITYSGDMTNASSGATEYMLAGDNLSEGHLIFNNVFTGDASGSVFDVIVGKGDNIGKEYMMDPNNIWFSAKTESISKQSLIGLIRKNEKDQMEAIILNSGFGYSQVSGDSNKNTLLRKALIHRWTNCFSLNYILESCGAKINNESPDKCDIDLTPSKLEKDTILSLFKEQWK